MRDTGPDEFWYQRVLTDRWFSIAESYGFEPVEFAPLGFASTFEVGHNAAGNRTFQFEDRAGRELALASDSLPLATRYLSTLQTEQRVSFNCSVFRYIRQPRRQYHHLGVTQMQPIAATTAEADAYEVTRLCLVIGRFLPRESQFVLEFNEVGAWRSILGDVVEDEEGITSLMQILERTAVASDSDPAEVLSSHGVARISKRLEQMLELMARGRMSSVTLSNAAAEIGGEAGQRLDALTEMLQYIQGLLPEHVTAVANAGNFHAAEFHDGISFQVLRLPGEVPIGDGGSVGAFAERFLGKPARLFSAVVVPERLTPPRRPARGSILLRVGSSKQAIALGCSIAEELRNRNVAVWDSGAWTRRLSKDLALAESVGIRFSLIIDEQECRSGVFSLRDEAGGITEMDLDGLRVWADAWMLTPS